MPQKRPAEYAGLLGCLYGLLPSLSFEGIHILLRGLDILLLCGLGLIHIALLHLLENFELILGAFAHKAYQQRPEIASVGFGTVFSVLLYSRPLRMQKVCKKFLFTH